MDDVQKSGAAHAELRAVRPTVRCLVEDLGLPLPSARQSLADLGHPLLDAVKLELEREREQAAAPTILTVGDHQVALVADAYRGICWVCGIRRDAQPLAIPPSKRDDQRLVDERASRLVDAAKELAAPGLRLAQRQPDVEHRVLLAEEVEIITYRESGGTRVYVALPLHRAAVSGVEPDVCYLLIAAIGVSDDVDDFGPCACWPARLLTDHELAWFDLHEEQ